jgi:hypothetical protein
MKITKTLLVLSIAVLVLVVSGCATPVPPPQMKVSAPETAHVGERVIVLVLFENRPQGFLNVDVEFSGFGPCEPKIPPAFKSRWGIVLHAGDRGDREMLDLSWNNSNCRILEAPPELLMPPDYDGFGYSWEALAAGTTEMTLALTESDGNVIERTLTLTVVE